MATAAKSKHPVKILLVEDSPSDALLAKEALAACDVSSQVHHVVDGVEAMAFLRREGEYRDAPTPDLVLLDLKMPRKDGREVLCEVKADDQLRHIPIIVLTTSVAPEDIAGAYHHHANCYVAKPMDYGHFVGVMKVLEQFWFQVATLPG